MPDPDEDNDPVLIDVPRRVLLIAFGLGAMVALAIIVALALLTRSDSPDFPPGYYGDVQRLSQETANDLAVRAPVAFLQGCLDGDPDACRRHGVNATGAAARLRAFVAALDALDIPPQARDWQRRYTAALAALSDAFTAQAAAIEGQDADAFARAVTDAQAHSGEEIALNDEFNRRFGEELR